MTTGAAKCSVLISGPERPMFVVQTGHAKRTRKYSIAMLLLLLLMGSFAALLTLHWEVKPQKK
jgi:hypothetical protein